MTRCRFFRFHVTNDEKALDTIKELLPAFPAPQLSIDFSYTPNSRLNTTMATTTTPPTSPTSSNPDENKEVTPTTNYLSIEERHVVVTNMYVFDFTKNLVSIPPTPSCCVMPLTFCFTGFTGLTY